MTSRHGHAFLNTSLLCGESWLFVWTNNETNKRFGDDLIHVRQDAHVTSLQWFNIALQWRHNGRDNVSNHQPHDCILNRLFRRRSKKTSKLRVTGLCAGNSPETGGPRWIPRTNGQLRGKCIHLVTSSWSSSYRCKMDMAKAKTSRILPNIIGWTALLL